MEPITTYRGVIDLWRKRTVLAAALLVDGGLIRTWYKRDNIPEAHWLALVKAARGIGHSEISYALLNSFKPGAALDA